MYCLVEVYLLGFTLRHLFVSERGKSKKYIKVRYDGGLTVPGDWVIFLLISVTVGGRFLTGTKG